MTDSSPKPRCRTRVIAPYGEGSGHGTVWLFARDASPVITRRQLPGDIADKQSRYLEAAVNGVLVACIYLPNGNPQPGPKFDYKLAWFEGLIAHAATLFATDAPVVLAGDFNVVPTNFEIYPTKSWAKDALVQPAPRACFRRLLDQGWVEAIRTLHPSEPMFTFWDYKRERWPRDAGLRLDDLLLNPTAAARLVDAGVDRDVRGEDGASDHAPAWKRLRRRRDRKGGELGQSTSRRTRWRTASDRPTPAMINRRAPAGQ